MQKKEKMRYLIIYILFQLVNPVFGQINDLPPDDGNCYGKAYLLPTYVIEEIKLPLYLGEETKLEGLEELELMIQDSESIPIYKKPKGRSEKVLCWEITEPIIEKLIIVKDTLEIREFFYEIFEVKKIVDPLRMGDWRQVKCIKDLSIEEIEKIERVLQESGEYGSKLIGKYTNRLKEGLIKYQIKNNLPVGLLDKETMDFMEVDMFWDN